MSKRESTNTGKIFILIVGIIGIIIVLLLIFQDKSNIEYYKDINTKSIYDTVPKDVLLKTYEDYNNLLVSHLLPERYKEVIKNENIEEKKFSSYDFLALFYETKSCNSIGSKPTNISMQDDKIIINVKKYEDTACEKSTHILFIQIEKDKYNKIPAVVIKKQ